MKKTLLVALSAIMTVGAASALPSPGDRKALCEQHPDKYVWVEKSQACVPINPCLDYKSELYPIYCAFGDRGLYSHGEGRDRVLNRYAEQVLGTTVSDIKEIGDNEMGSLSFVGVKTADGGYFVAGYRKDSKFNLIFRGDFEYVGDAVLAYGVKTNMSAQGANVEIQSVPTEETCQDIADLASVLAGKMILKTGYNNRVCMLKVED